MSIAALVGAIGQLTMKYAAVVVKEDGVTLLTGGLFFLAFSLYGLVMLLFLQGLKHGRELSTTYPVYSLTFPFAAALGWLVFAEVMDLMQWVGLTLICAGVGVMNIPEKRRQEPQSQGDSQVGFEVQGTSDGSGNE